MWALPGWALRSSLVAAAVAVLGCFASPSPQPQPSYAAPAWTGGGDPARLAGPSAPSQGMRWEQFCEQSTSVAQASWLATSRGADGWELVSMYNGVLCYKRPELARAAPPSPPLVGQHPPATAPVPVTNSSQTTAPKIIDPGF